MSAADCDRVTRPIMLGVLLVLQTAGVVGSASGQCEYAKLLAETAHAGDQFGVSVAVDGDTAVIGADNAWGTIEAMGAAYVFRFDGMQWVFEQELTAPDADGPDHFGVSVAIDDDTLLVGAHYDDDLAHNCGSAYVFRFDGAAWVEQAKLVASDGTEFDYFGEVLALSGDVGLICSPWDTDNGGGSGSAYIFRRDDNGTPTDPSDDTWLQHQKILPEDGAAWEFFGYAATITGDTAVIGARWDDDNGFRSGSAYVFRRSDAGTPEDPSDDVWAQEAKLLASDGGEDDWFGMSAALVDAGDLAVVGAERDDDNGVDSGSAYVFRWGSSGWSQVQKLLARDGAPWDRFGCAVRISGPIILVGAYNDGSTGQAVSDGRGSAYVFGRDDHGTPGDPNDDSWLQQAKLSASDGAVGDNFAISAGLSGETAVIGAYQDDNESGVDAGSAYVFDLAGGDCNRNHICDSLDIADGTSEDINCTGIPDECECIGDLDDDGEVGLPDLALLLSNYGMASGGAYSDGDFDCDGDVDLTDLAELLSRYGDSCT